MPKIATLTDPGRAHYVPRREVWTTKKVVTRRDPATGRPRKVRLTLVRWLDADGRPSQRGFEDPIAAGAFAAQKRVEIRTQSGAAPVTEMTLGEWSDTYLSRRSDDYAKWKSDPSHKLPDGYITNLKVARDKFVEAVGDRPLATYTPLDFEAFRARMNSRPGRRPATTEGYLQRLRTIFRAAAKAGVVARCPEIKVRQVAYEKPVLERDEVRTVLDKARGWPNESHTRRGARSGRMHPILCCLYYAALRRGELIHLAWDDLRRENGVVTEILVRPKTWHETGRGGVVKQLSWEPKDREVRAIPVHPALAAAFEELAKQRAHPLWVFTDVRRKRWTENGLTSFMHRFEDAIDMRLGFHVWRRTALTHLHDAEAPVKHIQEIAGHSKIETTMKYVRSTARERRQTILKLA